MPTAIDKIVDGFPFPTIPPISGTPTYNTIAEVNFLIKFKLRLYPIQPWLRHPRPSPTDCVTPRLQHLVVHPFILPINPGSVPIIPDNSTGAQITKLCYAFDTVAALFNEYDRTDKALRPILLSTVDKIIIRYLRHKYFGYSLATTCPILDHLYATYANISSADLQVNDAVICTPYDINQPIETLFGRVNNCGDCAAAGNTPYSLE